MVQRIELVLGIAAALVGLVGWCYALFAPIYLSSEGTRASVAQVSLNAGSITFFILMLLAIVGLAASTYRRSHRGRRGRLSPVWICAGIIVVGTYLSGFSVGLFFLPSAILAVCTGLVASLVDSRMNRDKPSQL